MSEKNEEKELFGGWHKDDPFPEDCYDLAKGRGLFSWLPGASFWYLLGVFWNIVHCSMRLHLKPYSRELFYDHALAEILRVARFGGSVHVEGINNIRAVHGAPVVFVGNHMSLLETMAISAFLMSTMDGVFVVKESLLKYPFFGYILKQKSSIGVSRVNPRNDLNLVMTEGLKRLEEGRSIIIFPQSTRSEKFDEKSFNSMGVKLAKKAKVKVIPVAVRTDFIANGTLIKDFGKIRPERPVCLAFGEALNVEELGNEAHQKSIDFIRSKLNSWGVCIDDSENK